MADEAGQVAPVTIAEKPARGTGSLSRRMIIIAAGWITLLLIAGGLALDRVLVNAVSDNFDDQMEYVLTAMLASAEIGPDGEVRLNRPLGDQRFLEPNSGLYWQISGKGKMAFPSRSLWDRTLRVDLSHTDSKPHFRNSAEFDGEPLRIVERAIVLPDSETRWIFMVAQSRESLDAQITELRTVLATAFAVLAFGLIIMAALQTFYGLWPLRDVRREIAYVGDTLNVAARLLEASKELGRDVLVSAELLALSRLPPDLQAEPLPTLSIRGRDAPLEIAALSLRVGQDQV